MEKNRDFLSAFNRLGEFGKLFFEGNGCPRGQMGRACCPIEEEVMGMKPIRDIDGGEWIPVNAEALRELVHRYVELRKQVEKLSQDNGRG